MDLTKLASVLGLKETATLAEIETAAAMQALQLTQLQTSQLDSLTTEAVAKGVVTEETKASFKKLAAIDFASAKEMVTGFKTLTVSHKAEKTTVAPEQSVDLLQLLTKLATQGGITNDPKDRTQWNFDQWSKQDSDGLMKLKAVDSAKYNALIEKHRAENAHHLG